MAQLMLWKVEDSMDMLEAVVITVVLGLFVYIYIRQERERPR